MTIKSIPSSACAQGRPTVVVYTRLIDLFDFLRRDLPFNVIVNEQALTPAAEVSDGGADEPA